MKLNNHTRNYTVLVLLLLTSLYFNVHQQRVSTREIKQKTVLQERVLQDSLKIQELDSMLTSLKKFNELTAEDVNKKVQDTVIIYKNHEKKLNDIDVLSSDEQVLLLSRNLSKENNPK